MRFTIAEEDLDVVRSLKKDLLIGIVMRGGEVRLQVSDMHVYRGHVAWLSRDSIPRDAVERGFAIGVKEGHVQYLNPNSELNPNRDRSLLDDEIEQLKDLLPLSEDFKVFK